MQKHQYSFANLAFGAETIESEAKKSDGDFILSRVSSFRERG